MKKIYLVIVLAMSTLCAFSQAYMATKAKLDSMKVNKFSGDAALGLKIEQTDKLKIELNAALEFLVPTKYHLIRLKGNTAYNFQDFYDNGNRGFLDLGVNVFQYEISETKREKKPCFFDVDAAVQYDYCRFLDLRTFASAAATFQPLRDHAHICLEPSVGLMGDFQKWDILNGDKRADLRTAYLALSPEQQNYLGVNTNNWEKWQMMPRLFASLNFMGDWDIAAFNFMVVVGQPLMPTFKVQQDMEESLPDCFKGLYNTNLLPIVNFETNLKVRLHKNLSLVLTYEFVWDGGQLPRSFQKDVVINGVQTNNTIGAYDIRYCFITGLQASW